MMAGRTRDGRVACRLLALALVLDGHDRSTAAQLSGMDRQTLRDWVIRFNETGLAGLSNQTVPGPPPSLSAAQLAEIKEIVLAGPDPEQQGVVRWRCVDLQSVIADRFGVRFHEATVGKLLRKLNLTRLQPRPTHPGKSPEAEVNFKKTSATSSAKLSASASAPSRSKSGFRCYGWDLNPVPTDLKEWVLTTNIDLDEGTCSIDLLEAASVYYALTLVQARGIIKEVARAVALWLEVAREVGARAAEISRVASAFGHTELQQALAI